MAKRRGIMALPGGVLAVPHNVKCYRVGCRRYYRGYLSTDRSPGGTLYDKHGHKVADLRAQDYACPKHGIADGSAPFLYSDPPKQGQRRRYHGGH